MALLGALVASGAAGLLYQVCWIRSATLVVGSTTYALGVVLATFFGGLALGSALFGRVATRMTRPLRVYALLEIGIAILGLGSIVAFGLVDTLLTQFSGWASRPVLVWAAEIVCLTAVLTPPAVLMGGTLPLFCRYFVNRHDRLLSRVSWLYALNTLGAAAGCVVAGLYLIPAIGLRGTVILAASLNVVAATIAWFAPIEAPDGNAPAPLPAAAPSPRRRGPRKDVGPVVTAPPPSFALMSVLMFFTGVVALGNEVLWTRFAALLVSNTVTTYTVTIAIVLVGIAAGSALVSGLGRVRHPANVFALLQALLAVWVLAVMHLRPETWLALGDRVWMYVLLFLPPSILSGASFPLGIRVVTQTVEGVPSGVGQLGAANMAGGIVGAVGAGFLLPVVGIQTGIVVTTWLSLLTAWLAWLAVDRQPGRALPWVLSAIAGLVWVAIPRLAPIDIPRDFLTRNGVVIAVREGAQSNLAVSRADGRTLLTSDHWWQGQDEKSHQIMAAHVPMLFHPAPRNVLVVGVGAGQTPARFTMYDIARLDAVDIDPAVFEIVREHFDGRWMDDPRVRLLAEDGRTVIQRSRDRYDVISIEVGQLLRPGVGVFYTKEFYERVRGRLNDEGIVSQFVPLSFLTPAEFRSVVRTFLEVFPQAVLWYNRSEPLLIGTTAPRIVLDPARLALLESPGAVHDDLQFSLWGGEAQWQNQPDVFVASFLAGPSELARVARDGEILTDDRPVLDYRAGRALPEALSQDPILVEVAANLDPIAGLLAGEAPGNLVVRATRIREQHVKEMLSAASMRRGVEGPAAR